MPQVSPEEAKRQWQNYQNLKKEIIENSDIQIIQGNKFLKKSYWRKLATYFNITTEVISEKPQTINNVMVWHFTVKATAPNGRSATGVGSCDQYEKAKFVNGKYVDKWNREVQPNNIHNIRSTAETRATNRAISNLVGGGEVSAEEVSDNETITPIKQTPSISFKKIELMEDCDACRLKDGKVTEVAKKQLENTKKVWGVVLCAVCEQKAITAQRIAELKNKPKEDIDKKLKKQIEKAKNWGK